MAKRGAKTKSNLPLSKTVLANTDRNTTINKDFKLPPFYSEDLDPDRKYYCTCCGKKFPTQRGNFSKSKSLLYRGNNGYIPICKECLSQYYLTLAESFYEGEHAEEKAIERICQIVDWPYSERAVELTMNRPSSMNRITSYPSKINITAIQKKDGETYLDTLKLRSANNNLIMSEDDIDDEEEEVNLQDSSESTENEGFKVTKEIIRTWGTGFTPEQYEYLEDQYSDWKAKCVCNTKPQEELYKNLARAQLNVIIAQQGGGKVSDALNDVQKLMSSANILPKQNSDNPYADTETFGTLLKKYEETRPIPEPAPEWRDVDGIRKYVNTWFRGGLAKALHIENKNTKLFDEQMKEMNRYTVSKTDVTNSSEGMGDTILGSMSKPDGENNGGSE